MFKLQFDNTLICCGDDYVVEQVNQAMPESPTVKTLISIGPDIPEGFHDWMKEWNECAPFVRPEHVNSNEETLLMYFTSGTTGEPKMVAHDHLYALGHLTTGVYWHNLHENSIRALCAAADTSGECASVFYVMETLPGADSVTQELTDQMTAAGWRAEVISAYQTAGGAPYLDYTDTVFGQVYEGMDVVDAIARTGVDEAQRPTEPITINSVTITKYE